MSAVLNSTPIPLPAKCAVEYFMASGDRTRLRLDSLVYHFAKMYGMTELQADLEAAAFNALPAHVREAIENSSPIQQLYKTGRLTAEARALLAEDSTHDGYVSVKLHAFQINPKYEAKEPLYEATTDKGFVGYFFERSFENLCL